jgi:hypothetical protein
MKEKIKRYWKIISISLVLLILFGFYIERYGLKSICDKIWYGNRTCCIDGRCNRKCLSRKRRKVIKELKAEKTHFDIKSALPVEE